MGVRVPTALRVAAVTIPLHACACDTCAQTPPWPCGVGTEWDSQGMGLPGGSSGRQQTGDGQGSRRL